MATARALASNTMARVEVVPWSMARTSGGLLMACGPAAGCASREGSAPRGKVRPDRQLIQAAAGDTAAQGTRDRHPPVVLRRRQRLRAPAGEVFSFQPFPRRSLAENPPRIKYGGPMRFKRHRRRPSRPHELYIIDAIILRLRVSRRVFSNRETNLSPARAVPARRPGTAQCLF